MPATIADVSERLVKLTVAIETRTKLEEEKLKVDDKRETRLFYLIYLLVVAVLSFAGIKFGEILGWFH